MTTVGYGDFVPTNDSNRLFTIIYILFGVIYIFSTIADVAQSVLERIQEKATERFIKAPTEEYQVYLKHTNIH